MALPHIHWQSSEWIVVAIAVLLVTVYLGPKCISANCDNSKYSKGIKAPAVSKPAVIILKKSCHHA